LFLICEDYLLRDEKCQESAPHNVGRFSYIQKVDEIAFEKFKKLTPNPLTNFPK